MGGTGVHQSTATNAGARREGRRAKRRERWWRSDEIEDSEAPSERPGQQGHCEGPRGGTGGGEETGKRGRRQWR